MKTFELSQIEIHNGTEEEIRRKATEAGFSCGIGRTLVYRHPDKDSMVFKTMPEEVADFIWSAPAKRYK